MIWLNRPTADLDPALAETPLSVRGLTGGYGDRPVLLDLDFDLAAGERCAIVGPNGAGKSTFLKTALGLIPAWSGEVRFFGRPLSGARQRLAYVPQREEVDWQYPASAREVVLMGRYNRLGLWKRPSAEDHRAVDQAIERVGLVGLANSPIGALSGGQQQRVFLARALASEAELFLLDEPTQGLDQNSEASLFKLLDELCREGRTALVVHHDLDSLEAHFDRALLLSPAGHFHGTPSEVLGSEALSQAYAGLANGARA